MEILQPLWRGAHLQFRKDVSGKFVAMIGNKSLLYTPISDVFQDSRYRLTIEMKSVGGNGLVSCNIYGNRMFDFQHASFQCNATDWKTYDVDVSTRKFPNTLPLILRLWRPIKGTGEIHIRRIIVQLLSNEEKGLNPNTNSLCNDIIDLKESINNEITPEVSKQEENIPNVVKTTISHSNFFKHISPEFYNGKRVLYLPLGVQEPTEDGFVQNGFDLISFDFLKHRSDFKNKMEGILGEFKPDLVHMQLQFTNVIPASDILYLKNKFPSVCFSNWTGDIREDVQKYFVDVGKVVDHSLMSNVGQIELYGSHGVRNCDYWQIGYDPKRFYKMSDAERKSIHNKYGCKISFCGGCYSHFSGFRERVDLIKLLQSNFKDTFKVFGNGWPHSRKIDFSNQFELYNSCDFVISINNINHCEKYFSDRQLVAMACGTPVLSYHIPRLEEYFEDEFNTLFFKTPEECLNKIKKYYEDYEKAAEIGELGYLEVLRNHTFFSRVIDLKRIVKIDHKKINLFLEYYSPEDADRKLEIDESVIKNINNKYIDSVYLLCENGVTINKKFISKKVKIINISSRQKYQDIFNIINNITKDDEINIICNCDIEITEEVNKLRQAFINNSDLFLAISRWDLHKNGELVYRNKIDSQDAWSFLGRCRINSADFYMGKPGCDNRLAYIAKENQYCVIDPALDVKIIHRHVSNVRTYSQSDKVNGNYLLLYPGKLK